MEDKSMNGASADGREFASFVRNVMLMRSQLMRQIGDPRRSIEDECGYPTGNIATADYQDLYDRDAVAVRVVQVLPRECWQVQPLIYERESSVRTSSFEGAWKEVGKDMGGEPGYYEDDELNPLCEYLRRVDELSGIGHYGVMFLGVDDGRHPSEPADFQTANAADLKKLRFVRVFPESLVGVAESDNDPKSPRWGRPLRYNITFGTPALDGSISSISMTVHWTRIVHVADNLDSNELYGVPRMKPVYNRLRDLHKLYACSAEMYYRGAFPGLSVETHPQLNPTDIQMSPSDLKEMMEDYGNSLQRYIALMGMTAKSLAPQVVDPTPQIRVQIEAICIRLGVPKRIFMGSERGELASAQDDKTWNDALKERQKNYITPRLISPFIDRLINLGVLPKPRRYRVAWPDMTFQSEQDRIKVAIVKTEALLRYGNSLPNPLIAPRDFLTMIMNYTVQEADAILEGVKLMGWDKVLPNLDAVAKGALNGGGESSGGGRGVSVGGTRGSSGKVLEGTFVKPLQGQVVSDLDGTIRIPGGAKGGSDIGEIDVG